MTLKYLQSKSIFRITTKNGTKIVRPVDGETHFGQLGLSAGFIHFADPETGGNIGYCGTNYFDENAEEICSD